MTKQLFVLWMFLLPAGSGLVVAQPIECYPSCSTINGTVRCGYRNADSQLVIPAVYEIARGFSENYATVKKDGVWAFILRSGKVVVSLPGYSDVGQLHAGLAYMANNSLKYGYIDANGTVRIPPQYELASDFNLYNVGSARVMKPGSMEFITLENPLLETAVAVGQQPLKINGKQSGADKFSEAIKAYRAGDYLAAMPPVIGAAYLGYPEAISLLGSMYFKGHGCTKNDVKALEYWRKAAHRGEPSGLLNAGIAYAIGTGTAVNYTLALFYYQHAAGLGNATAMKNIGLLYLEGKGVAANNYTAVSWFEKAADAGDIYSAYALGFAARYGVGYTRDDAAARKWLGVAAGKQYQDAARILYEMDHSPAPVIQGRYNKDFMNDPTLQTTPERPQVAKCPYKEIDFSFPKPSYKEQLQEQRNRDYYNDISRQERETRRYNDKWR